MNIELMYFEGCPTYGQAEKRLRSVLSEEGIEASLAMVCVGDHEEAERLRFPGSPTIRVDGKDLFGETERDGYSLGCRVYATPEGLEGAPTEKMLRSALAKEARLSRRRHPG